MSTYENALRPSGPCELDACTAQVIEPGFVVGAGTAGAAGADGTGLGSATAGLAVSRIAAAASSPANAVVARLRRGERKVVIAARPFQQADHGALAGHGSVLQPGKAG